MKLEDPDLQFIRFVETDSMITGKNREKILGTVWKMRTQIPMIKYAMALVEYGNTHLSACRDIIYMINDTRKKVVNPYSSDGSWPPVNFFIHDEISGFDSEAGNEGEASVYVNLCGKAAYKDKSDRLWYVPMIVVIFHELGHYLQYLSDPKYYNLLSVHPDEGQHHLLDAMNVPDNEHPLCKELGMGVRELYLDMQDVNSPQFAGLTLNYTRHLENKYARDNHGFTAALEPEGVRRAREDVERRAREAKGLKAASASPMVACSKCGKEFRKMAIALHENQCKPATS